MNSFKYLDFADDFTERFHTFSERFETYILQLQDIETCNDSIQMLFHEVHTLKALSTYVGFDDGYKTFKTIEDILQILISRQARGIKQEFIDWFLLINDLFLEWDESFEKENFNLEGVDQYLLNMIKISTIASNKSKGILKHTNLFIQTKKPSIVNTFNALKKYFKTLSILDEPIMLKDNIQTSESNIILLSTDISLDAAKQLYTKGIADKIIFIIILESNDFNDSRLKNRLSEIGFRYFLNIDDSKKSLLRSIESIAKLNQTTDWIRLSDSVVTNNINQVEPLPEVIHDIQRIVADENFSTKQLTETLSQDPTLVAKILKSLNSPEFGLKSEVSNLHYAVSLLGKNHISAIALMESTADTFNKYNLSPYGLHDQRMLYSISKKRMRLMSA